MEPKIQRLAGGNHPRKPAREQFMLSRGSRGTVASRRQEGELGGLRLPSQTSGSSMSGWHLLNVSCVASCQYHSPSPSS